MSSPWASYKWTVITAKANCIMSSFLMLHLVQSLLENTRTFSWSSEYFPCTQRNYISALHQSPHIDDTMRISSQCMNSIASVRIPMGMYQKHIIVLIFTVWIVLIILKNFVRPIAGPIRSHLFDFLTVEGFLTCTMCT